MSVNIEPTTTTRQNASTNAPAYASDESDSTNTTYRAFDANLVHSIGMELDNDNVLISPFLIEVLLALLYLSADGNTADELQKQLQLKKRFTSNSAIANFYATHLALTTNAINETYITPLLNIVLPAQQTVGEELQQIGHKYFGTHIKKAKSDGELNAMLIEQFGTKMSAKDLVATEEDICLTISAAIKFKWFLPFSTYRTGIYDFHMLVNNNNLTVCTSVDDAETLSHASNNVVVASVPMLFDDDMYLKFGEFNELDARAIELPFEHDELELNMLIVLPNKRDGLSALLQQLQKINVSELSEQRMQMESVQVLLPKFNIDYTCTLREALGEFGISGIFNKLANLKHLVAADATTPLKIANIWHKATLAIHESGSEPSSTLSLKPIVITNSLNSRQKFFRADHPFYFAIRAGQVTYFAGQITRCNV